MEQFLVSVATAYIYDDSDTLLATARTMLDTSLALKTAITDIRGGRGASLLYLYTHSPDLTLTLTDTQFNLAFLAMALGQSADTGGNIYTEESVTLNSSLHGTVTGTPLAIQGTSLFGWVTHNTGTHAGQTEQVIFTSKTFTSAWGTSGEVVCVRYYAENAAANSVTIYANNVPSIVRIVLDSQLAETSQVGFTNSIGVMEILIPRAKLLGNFTISMKADGVSTTPLEARALASPNPDAAGCINQDILAKITTVLTGAHWYDDVVALGIQGGDFDLAVGDTYTLDIIAIKSNGATFRPPYADLTFASSLTGHATISNAGLVTGIAAGQSNLSVMITATASTTKIDAVCVVTVP